MMLLGKSNGFFIKTVIRRRADRVGGVGNNHIFCRLCVLFRNVLKVGKKIIFLIKRIGHTFYSHQLRPDTEYRITRIRNQNHIARIAERQSNMGHSLLRTVHTHDLARFQLHAEPVPVKIPHSL